MGLSHVDFEHVSALLLGLEEHADSDDAADADAQRDADVDTDDDADSGTGTSSGVTVDLGGARANSEHLVAAGVSAGRALGIFGASAGWFGGGGGVDGAQ